MSNKIIIGIDPGTTTGIAVKDISSKQYLFIESMPILKAMEMVKKSLIKYDSLNVYLVFEDARQRKYFGKSGREKLQGAGSIKRDCAIWQEFCEMYLKYWKAERPKRGATKHTADYFKRLTGWAGTTNEHARDAAMLIFGYTANNLKLHFHKKIE